MPTVSPLADDGTYTVTWNAEEGDFGGLNEFNSIKPSESPKLYGVYRDEAGVLRLKPALKTIGHDSDLDDIVLKRAFTYTAVDGIERYVVTDNINVWISADNNIFTVLPDYTVPANSLTFDADYELRFCSWNHNLYMTNGFDWIVRYDGTDTFAITTFSDASPATDLKGRYLEIHNGVLWILNTDVSGERAYHSNTDGTFDPLSFLDFGSNRSGEGIGLKSHKNGLIVFKTDKSFILTGYSPETYQIIPIGDDTGCVNGDSIVDMDGRIVYLAKDGFRITDGINSVLLPSKLKKLVTEIVQANIWKKFNRSIKLNFLSDSINAVSGTLENRIYFSETPLNTDGIFLGGKIYTDSSWPVNSLSIFKDQANPIDTFELLGDQSYYDISDGAGYVKFRGKLAYGYTYMPYVTLTLKKANSGEILSKKTIVWGLNPPGFAGDSLSRTVTWNNAVNAITDKTRVYMEIKLSNYGYETDLGPIIKSNEFLVYGASKSVGYSYNNINATAGYELVGGVYKHYFQITGLTGRAEFLDSTYHTKTFQVDNKGYGVFSYTGQDLNGHAFVDPDGSSKWTITPYIRFSNDSDSLTSNAAADFLVVGGKTDADGWKAISNGDNIQEIIADLVGGPTTAYKYIQFRFEFTTSDSNLTYYPYELTNFTFSWYYSTSDVGISNHGLSAAKWKDNYLMAFTKVGDVYNNYVLCVQRIGTQNVEYFLWRVTGAVSVVPYGDEITILRSYDEQTRAAPAGVNLIQTLNVENDNYYDNGELPFYYETSEFRLPIGVYKQFELLSLSLDDLEEGSNPFTIYSRAKLNIEIWIDSQYAGTLDISGNKIEHRVINYMQDDEEFWLPDVRRRLNSGQSTSDVVVLGWGNKIKFKIHWLYDIKTVAEYGKNTTRYVFDMLKIIAMRLHVRPIFNAVPNPALNIREGTL